MRKNYISYIKIFLKPLISKMEDIGKNYMIIILNKIIFFYIFLIYYLFKIKTLYNIHGFIV